MEPEVGISVSRQAGANAALLLRSGGFAPERVQLLLPATLHAEDVMPTDDAGELAESEAFRRGYERGLSRLARLAGTPAPSEPVKPKPKRRGAPKRSPGEASR